MGQAKRGDRDTRGNNGTGAAFATLLAAGLLCFGLFSPSAQAKEVRLLQGQIGNFAQPRGLAVDQATHDVYVSDGRNEQQRITISATSGKFKLKYKGETTKDLPFNAQAGEVRDTLEEIVCKGEDCIAVNGGPGDEKGSHPYEVFFSGSLATTDAEQIECAPGTIPLSGGSGCSATTTANGVHSSIARYHADGTPSDFSGLATNSIDGRGPDADQTPQNALHIGNAIEAQVAIDESGGETDGEIYVPQSSVGLVDVFAPSGEYLAQLSEFKEGPTAAGPLKPLNEPCGVAADSTGNVYVGDFSGGIHVYDPAGKAVANADNVANFTSVGFPCAVAAGAGPAGGSLFAISFISRKLFKLDAGTGALAYGGKPISEGGNTALAVDPETGHVLAAEDNEVEEWDASGESAATLLGSIERASMVKGLAVDASGGEGGTLYLAREKVPHLEVFGPLAIVPDVTSEAASGVGLATATLHGTIGAGGGPQASCHFQYLTDATYQAQKQAAKEASEPKSGAEVADAAFAGAQSAPCSPAGPFTGNGLNAVSAKVEGLAHETAYRFRLVGENSNGSSVSAITDPKNPACSSDAVPCSFSFETFGKPKVRGGEASEVTTSAAKISGEVNPAGQQTEFAVQYVTEAEFKASGFNEATSVPEPAEDLGSGTSFLAVSAQLSGLASDTAYRFRIAATNADGTRMGKEGSFATFAPPSGLLDERAFELVSPAVRMGEVYPLETYNRVGLGGSCTSCVPGFSTNESSMQSSPDGDAVSYEGDPFWPGLAPEGDSYVARRGEGGWQTAALSTPELEGQAFSAFSPDLSKAVMQQAEPSLTPEAPANFANLYLREEGKGLKALVTVKPPSRSPGTLDSNHFTIQYAGANAGTEAVAALSHVIFQANDALTEAVPGIAPKAPAVKASETDLYEWSGGQLHLVNVLPGNEKAAANATIGSGLLLALNEYESFDFDHAISDDGRRVFFSTQPAGQVYVREDAASTAKVPDPGKFITASPDGSRVLLSDGALYDFESQATTDLTGGAGGFQGMVGASEDLTRIYFVDTEALTPPGEENANPAGPEHAEGGKFNLYFWESGALGFIGRLTAVDNGGSAAEVGDWHAAPGNRLAQASADGRFLAFESTAPLTGYDNTTRDGEGCRGIARVGPPQCFEVFEYDAANRALTCVSCNPSGVRPLGGASLSLLIHTLFNEFSPQPDNLPPAGEGRLFFQSLEALTPADTNGLIQDVYEFEPNGVGSCERAKGCLALISSGEDPNDSHFLNASATGDDAFFTTRAQLLPADGNELMDLYDARAGGGFEEPLPVPCEGEACKGPVPAAPEEPGALTQSFEGLGNAQPPRPCAKGKVRRHGKCLKRPRRHRHAHRNRRSSR